MSDLMSLKITIEHDANYLLFGDRICRDINELDAFCKNRYQDLQKNVEGFRYYWIDDDGDEIRIATDEDYQSFLQAMANAKARLYVVSKQTTLVQANTTNAPTFPIFTVKQNEATGDDVSSRPVHQYAICDVCDQQIVGHRYKCLTCHDYDLCMSCEAKFRHKDHLMLRIPKPVMVDRSQSTVSRMLDKLRIYSNRITTNMEKDVVPDAETSVPEGNESAETNASKRAYARSVHRSKHSEDRRTHETTKPFRSCRSSGNDRKHHSSTVGQTSGERSTQETKEKPSVPTLSEITQQCRDMMLMYLNSAEASGNAAGKTIPMSTGDHVAVAKVAAATASAAAARATALASKVMNANLTTENGQSQETAQPTQDMEQIFRQNLAQMRQKRAPSSEQQPSVSPTSSAIPIPLLPFVNLAWPTQDKLMVVSDSVSKLLDPLGLSFEIRHKSSSSPSTSSSVTKARDGVNDGTVPSTSATVAETTSTVESAVQKKQETTEPSVAEISVKDQQQANTAVPVCAESTANGTETEKSNLGVQTEKPVSATLESDFAAENKPEAEAENEVDDEDDSQNTSSASLLTDDDQDLLEAAKNESSKPPTKAEKSWTLIDLPQEHDEQRIANAPLDAIAKLIGRDLPSPDKERIQLKPVSSSKEKKKDDIAAEKQKESKHASITANEASATREQEYEMFRKILAEQTEKPERSVEVEKRQKPSSSSAPNAGPSSSSGSGSQSGKSSRKSSSGQQKDHTVYSHRPHVNHAIHTMMTMGFSNHNGWLTQLLESLNGDIPKALDLLLQHRH